MARKTRVATINSRELFQYGAVRPVTLCAGSSADFSKAIDLSNLVPQLDNTASGIVENQKDALVQRKELAQKTKDFRKLDDTEKLSEWKLLLKGILTISFPDEASPLNSLSKLCRPTYKPWQDDFECVPPTVLLCLRSPRSLPAIGSIHRLAPSVRRHRA